MSNCVDSSSNQVLMTACSLNNARSLCVEFPQNVVVDAEVIDKGMCSRDINNVNKGQNKRPLETGSEENFAKVLRVEEPSITQEKLRILNDVTRARRNQPATEAEIELRKTIERKRQARKKWNRKYWERTGRRITMVAIDRVKRIAAENDSLDSNLGDMMKVIDQLQVKFETKLAKRQQDIEAGLVDPEEAKGRNQERQMRHWLESVPGLKELYRTKEEKALVQSQILVFAQLPMAEEMADGDESDEHEDDSHESDTDSEEEEAEYEEDSTSESESESSSDSEDE